MCGAGAMAAPAAAGGRRVSCRILPAGGSTARREQRLQLSPLGMKSVGQGGVLADSCSGGREIRMVRGEAVSVPCRGRLKSCCSY